MKKLLLLISAIALTASNTFGQYTKLYDFKGVNGANPNGSLISDGIFLYGTTYSGGANNLGVVFKIKPDGTGYSKLLDFAGINGSHPNGSLIFVGTFLYGTTSKGGIFDAGTIFKIKSDGTGYSKLRNFVANEGGYPNGPLIFDGTFLYGTTSSMFGTLFKIKPDGTGFVFLRDFSFGTDSNSPTTQYGINPSGSLILNGSFLYGTTQRGGSNTHNGGCGTIFKIKPDGTGYSILLDFANYPNDGANPDGLLISVGTFLYGTTHQGGTNNGTFFKIKLDGTGYSKLRDFEASNTIFPNGSLISAGNFLYGTTYSGGANNLGVVFKMKSNGMGYSQLLNSNPLNGSILSQPVDSLNSDGNFSAWNDGKNYYYNIKQSTANKHKGNKVLWADNVQSIVPLAVDTSDFRYGQDRRSWVCNQLSPFSEFWSAPESWSAFKYYKETMFSSITRAVLSGKLKAYTNFPAQGTPLSIKEFNNILVQWDSTFQTEDPYHPGKMINSPLKSELTSNVITRLKFNETIEFDTVSFTLYKKVSSVTFYTYRETYNPDSGEQEIFYVKFNN